MKGSAKAPAKTKPRAKPGPKTKPFVAKRSSGVRKKPVYSKDLKARAEQWNRLPETRKSELIRKSKKTPVDYKNMVALASALATLGVEFETVSFAKEDMDPIRGLALSYAARAKVGIFAAMEEDESEEDPW